MERTVDREIYHTPGPSALTHSLLTRGKKSLVNKRPLSPVTSSYFTLSRYPLVTGWKYFGTETSQEPASGSQNPAFLFRSEGRGMHGCFCITAGLPHQLVFMHSDAAHRSFETPDHTSKVRYRQRTMLRFLRLSRVYPEILSKKMKYASKRLEGFIVGQHLGRKGKRVGPRKGVGRLPRQTNLSLVSPLAFSFFASFWPACGKYPL